MPRLGAVLSLVLVGSGFPGQAPALAEVLCLLLLGNCAAATYRALRLAISAPRGAVTIK